MTVQLFGKGMQNADIPFTAWKGTFRHMVFVVVAQLLLFRIPAELSKLCRSK